MAETTNGMDDATVNLTSQVKFTATDSNGIVKRFYPVSRSKDVDISENSSKDKLSEIDFDKLEKESILIYKTYDAYMADYKAGKLNNYICLVEETITSDDEVDSTTVNDIIGYLQTTHYFNISAHTTTKYNEIFAFPPTKNILSITGKGTKSGLCSLNGYLNFAKESVSTVPTDGYAYGINYYRNDELILSESFYAPSSLSIINIPIKITLPIIINDVIKVTVTDNCGANISLVNLRYIADFAFGGE